MLPTTNGDEGGAAEEGQDIVTLGDERAGEF